MASFCVGHLGAYAQSYSNNITSDNSANYRMDDGKDYKETVWVNKRYIPTDLRLSAPVPRHKLLANDAKSLPVPDTHWVRPREPVPKVFQRDYEEKHVYLSRPSTRCEEWSTLKQILPSQGEACPVDHPNWGSGFALPPTMTPLKQKRFPHINSPMTRYTDDMHATNRLFKLH